MMRLAVDVNRYSDFCRGVPEAVETVQAADEVVFPFITLAEIRAGFLAGTRARMNESALQEFLRSHRVAILFADQATTHFYAEIYADLRRAGTPIPTNDIWIAALVTQHGLTLFSRDRHFEKVPRVPRV